jgi:hypothetical protein
MVDRPQEIENDAEMSFFGEKRAMLTRARGRTDRCKKPRSGTGA